MAHTAPLIAAAVFLAVAVAAATPNPAAPAAAATPNPTAEAVTVRVNGLVCDFCARSIEAVLKRRRDVASVHVDLDRGEVHLGLRPGATLGDKELARLIRDSGYAVAAIERRPRP